MNTTCADETILKTDVLGRVKTPRERREQLLDKFEKSGLTGQKFAAFVGVKYRTFATWAQQRRRARGTYPVSRRLQLPVARDGNSTENSEEPNCTVTARADAMRRRISSRIRSVPAGTPDQIRTCQ